MNVDICRRGTIFRPRLPGMLVKSICCWGILRSAGGHPTSLRLTTVLLEESILFAVSLSGEFKMPGYVL